MNQTTIIVTDTETGWNVSINGDNINVLNVDGITEIEDKDYWHFEDLVNLLVLRHLGEC